MVDRYGITLNKKQQDEKSIEPTPGKAIKQLINVILSKEKPVPSSFQDINQTRDEGNQSLGVDDIPAFMSKQ